MKFAEVIKSERELRGVVGEPMARSLRKEIAHLDANCRAFIARSPFMLVASCDAQGRMDVSPKGDPAGFVQVLDEHTLAIPDRPGNRRLDGLRNMLDNPHAKGMLMVYVPDAKLGYVTDLWSPGRDPLPEKPNPALMSVVNTVKRAGIEPARFAGGHGAVGDYAPLAKLAGQ